MGQALDRDGNVLGEATGETAREVLDQLIEKHPDADEIRIRQQIEERTAKVAVRPLVTVGRTVLYTLSEQDAEEINRRRWPAWAQAHIGNPAAAGDEVPLVVVRVWPHEFGENVPGVNGQAFLDGNDTLWVTSAKEGTEPGTWAWPPRV
jgi:hypothetical protein